MPHGPGAHEVYRIAVKRANTGRGGSRHMWNLETGLLAPVLADVYVQRMLALRPDGKVLAGPVYEKEKVLMAEIDLAQVRQESMTLDVSGHYARPDAFEFRIIRHARPT